MRLNILSNKIGWFGKYSGYECLPNYFPKDINQSVHYAKSNIFNKIIGKVYQKRNGRYSLRPEEVVSEVRFVRKMTESSTSHILYLDAHLHLLSKFKSSTKNLTGTIHIPISFWNEEELKILSKLNEVIILYKEEVEKFGKYIPVSKINVIRHGVDIDYFCPGDPANINKNKVLFVGHFLRNFPMFMKVYEILSAEIAELEFHIIIPGSFRKDYPVLVELMTRKNVYFHENLSDDELVEQYQNSYVLLMPMLDSGANTAIVQAVSTGLPVITTDVGGIRSYGGGDIFPLVENDDHLEMVKLFKNYYFDSPFREKIARSQRDFALNHLDWNIIAKQHIDLYRRLEHKTATY